MENKIDCFMANLDGYVYLIPSELRDKFDGTDYYERKSDFSEYIFNDDTIIESISVDKYDLQSLIDGEFG